MKTSTLAILAICLASNLGCASITRGSSEAFQITTNVSADAVIEQKGKTQKCATPCSIKVKRRPPLAITITAKDYVTRNVVVESSVDGAGAAGMAGNVLLGGFIGAGVDIGTGAMHSHKPNPLHVDLEKAENQANEETAE